MRLRRFARVGRKCEIYQVVRLIDGGERGEEDHWLLTDRPDFDDCSLAARHGSGHTKAGLHFLWESHTEATTLTLILPDDAPDAVRARMTQWLEQWPGAVAGAPRIFVIPEIADADAQLMTLGSSSLEPVCCDISAGLRIWSDFGIHEVGYGRLLVSVGDVVDGERGRIKTQIWD